MTAEEKVVILDESIVETRKTLPDGWRYGVCYIHCLLRKWGIGLKYEIVARFS